jgi:catechol 2,3-dioxygenase-like lactoylglutathione lyase family enzyme
MTPLVVTDRLDHVHLNVTDRAAAVDWYARVLGLRVFGEANPPDTHPLFLATARGTDHCVSLFVGTPAEGPNRNVAFHADAQAFVAFANHLPQPDVIGHQGQPLTAADRHDYGMAITFDFLDLDGNHLELVTYDHDATRNLLMASA